MLTLATAIDPPAADGISSVENSGEKYLVDFRLRSICQIEIVLTLNKQQIKLAGKAPECPQTVFSELADQLLSKIKIKSERENVKM